MENNYMNSFDYIAEARSIGSLLNGNLAKWKFQIDDAIANGSTGTEILMSLRWNFNELLRTESEIPTNLVDQIKNYILIADKLLS